MLSPTTPFENLNEYMCSASLAFSFDLLLSPGLFELGTLQCEMNSWLSIGQCRRSTGLFIDTVESYDRDFFDFDSKKFEQKVREYTTNYIINL